MRNTFTNEINQILIYIILKKLYKLVKNNNLRNKVRQAQRINNIYFQILI
jgi:uncharacterized protein (UPF0297 family)